MKKKIKKSLIKLLYQKTETGVSALGMLSLCNSPLRRSSSPQTQVVGVADSRGSVNISSWDYDPQVEGVLSCPLPGIMVVQLLTQHKSPCPVTQVSPEKGLTALPAQECDLGQGGGAEPVLGKITQSSQLEVGGTWMAMPGVGGTRRGQCQQGS